MERGAAAGVESPCALWEPLADTERAQPFGLRRDRRAVRPPGTVRLYHAPPWRPSSDTPSRTGSACSPRRCRRRSRSRASSCSPPARATRPRETNGIAHFAEHMFFKGTERRPTARDDLGRDRRHRRRVQRFHGQGVHGVLRHVRRGASRRRVRRPRRHGPQLALRGGRDRAREGRDRRGDADARRHAARPHRHRLRRRFSTATSRWAGRSSAGRRPSGPPRARRSLSYLDSWYWPERMVVGVGGRLGDDLIELLERLLGDIGPQRPAMPDPSQLPSNGDPVALYTKDSDQAHVILGARSYPLGHPDRYALQLLTSCSAEACRRGSSPRCGSDVVSRTTCTQPPRPTRTQARSPRRPGSTSAASTKPSRRSAASCGRSVTEPLPAEELEKARAFAKGASRSNSRARTERSCSGCGARCSGRGGGARGSRRGDRCGDGRGRTARGQRHHRRQALPRRRGPVRRPEPGSRS